MLLSETLESEIAHIVNQIQSGATPKDCVPERWKRTESREEMSSAFHAVCLDLWIRLGDTALNRTGYTNAISDFWEEIEGKKEDEKSSQDIEHWDEAWYF